jgi:hypothetical protein
VMTADPSTAPLAPRLRERLRSAKPGTTLARTETTADGSCAVVGFFLELCSGFAWELGRKVSLRSGRGLVAFGIEHDEAARDFAGRGSGESGLRQDQVKHAAFSRGHGREGVGLACGSDFLNGCFSGELEIAVAGGFEVFGIERDAVVVLRLEAENLGGDVLDGVEELTVTSQKEGGIGTGQLDFEVGG